MRLWALGLADVDAGSGFIFFDHHLGTVSRLQLVCRATSSPHLVALTRGEGFSLSANTAYGIVESPFEEFYRAPDTRRCASATDAPAPVAGAALCGGAHRARVTRQRLCVPSGRSAGKCDSLSGVGRLSGRSALLDRGGAMRRFRDRMCHPGRCQPRGARSQRRERVLSGDLRSGGLRFAPLWRWHPQCAGGLRRWQ